jgi:hypothetical protein
METVKGVDLFKVIELIHPRSQPEFMWLRMPQRTSLLMLQNIAPKFYFRAYLFGVVM